MRKTFIRRLWKRATFPIGAPLWETGRGSFTGSFERHMKEGSENG